MANNPNAAANLKPCKKGEVRNPYGRPKKNIGQILDDLKAAGYEPVTKVQVAATYQTLLILPQDQLADLATNKHQPMLNRIIAKAILGGKGFENIEKMLDRAQGRAAQSMDVTSDGEKLEGLVIVRNKDK
jgi:hypothetical protein